jgi:hypothetical protein
MGNVSPLKTGVVLGTMIGGWHLLWAVLVAFGWAQHLINFIFWVHFIQPIYVVGPFNFGIALILILVTATIGFTLGYVFAVLWNWIHR